MKVTERRTIKRADIDLTVFGLGCASFGGLYTPADASDALATMQAAWDAGVRYFDAAPMYGLGRAEHLLGHFLREQAGDRSQAVLSTKVGRLMTRARPGRELPPEAPKNPLDPGWQNGLNFREVFDYSYDGIMRSFDDSQQRLGLPEIDFLYVHDIGRVTHADLHDHHWNALTSGGFKALSELRAAGLIKGFGLGVNEAEAISDAMNEVDLDCCLLAGRYTLLDRDAGPLLDKAHAQDVAIVIGGVFNSGILATGANSSRKFDYKDAPDDIVREVERLSAICARFDVPLGAAAVQFPMRNKAVSSVLVGAKNPGNITASIAWFERDIPDELWDALDAA
jgi:D-threo-aldose 1-dehydrogenase